MPKLITLNTSWSSTSIYAEVKGDKPEASYFKALGRARGGGCVIKVLLIAGEQG